MNRKQIVATTTGSILFLLNSLVVPWTFQLNPPEISVPAPYSLIFVPPQLPAAEGQPVVSDYRGYSARRWSTKLDTVRWLIQASAIHY
jgi:hypothetical protein